MSRMTVLSIGLVLALGAGPLRAQEAPPAGDAQRQFNSVLGAGAYGAAKADELIARLRKAPHGTPGQDTQRAFKSALAAARRDDPDAELQVGRMYAHGIGVKRNGKQAFEWFYKATRHPGPAGQMAANEIKGMLQAGGLSPREAGIVGMIVTLAKTYGGKGAGAGHAPGAGSSLAGEMMQHNLIENGDPLEFGGE